MAGSLWILRSRLVRPGAHRPLAAYGCRLATPECSRARQPQI